MMDFRWLFDFGALLDRVLIGMFGAKRYLGRVSDGHKKAEEDEERREKHGDDVGYLESAGVI